MKTKHKKNLLAAALVCAMAAISLPSLAQEGQKPLSAERAMLVTITAKVQAIDQAKREVTLKGPLGNEVTFVVDERVKRLNEVSVGDEVTADYYVSLAGEVRPPTEEEKKHPIVAMAGTARAPKGSAPARGALHSYKAVATVVGLDLPTESITLQGPLGRYLTIRAENVNNLKQLRLGDSVVVTYTEALAISLQKARHESTKE